MWAAGYIPDLAAFFGHTQAPTGYYASSELAYFCETCCVYGVAEPDSRHCWFCESSDSLKSFMRPAIVNQTDPGGLHPASYTDLEDVDSLVA